MYLLNVKILILSFGFFVFACHAWHLVQTGLNETYRVRHLSVYYTRVFLSIETPSRIFPTLIESSWPRSFVPLLSIIYPHSALHANGNHSDCDLIQQAIWTQVDNLGRLWVVDIGWRSATDICAPKLLVFDLMKNNVEVLRIDCESHLEPNDARLLVVQLGPPTKRCEVEKYIYFLLADDAHLLAYDIVEQKWLRRSLISRKYKGIIETPLPIKPIDIAFGANNALLLSDADGQLYKTSNNYLQIKPRNVALPSANVGKTTAIAVNDTETYVELDLLGSLLGPSKGMMVDQRTGALFYAVAKFGAIVRCKYHQNLSTKDNEIIYFTSKNIQQIFFGTDSTVWLLTNRTLKPEDNCFANM